MAVTFYDKSTGLVRRIVFDSILTDDQLETVHFPQADEVSMRIDMRVEDFDLSVIQIKVNRVIGLRL